MGKRVCLIDYENTALPGLDGLENLSEGDCLRIICSNESIGNTLLHILSIYRDRKVMVEVEYMSQRGSNALDFRISCDLGYFIAQGDVSQIYVVSKDRGYLHAISEASALNSDVLIVCGVSIRDCLFKVEHGMTELPIDDYIKPCKEAKEADAALRLEWQKANAEFEKSKAVKALDIIKKKVLKPSDKKLENQLDSEEKKNENKKKQKKNESRAEQEKNSDKSVRQKEKSSGEKSKRLEKKAENKPKQSDNKTENKPKQAAKEIEEKSKQTGKRTENKKKKTEKKIESKSKHQKKKTEEWSEQQKKKTEKRSEQPENKNTDRRIGNNKAKSVHAKTQEEIEHMTSAQKKKMQQEIKDYLDKNTSIEENYTSHLAALVVKEHSVMDFRRAIKAVLGKKHEAYEAASVAVYMHYRI